ncbi:hypothetical protein [Deinococcus sp.]|uniref:AfsR/SARP family transcriptional regulator n=1 Tax=Deinococcus sp. TaxID=47478 RepID=UPI0028699E95|nr:hypothetical protein [Deinococcus sp.]
MIQAYPAGATDSDDSLPDPVIRSRPDRRTSALLAYLSIEGPTPRSRLAGLLWPEVPEGTARANLRQTLRRLRQSGAAVGSGDRVRLNEPSPWQQ